MARDWKHALCRSDVFPAKSLLAQAASVATALVLFALFKWFTYGTLLPHAFELKRVTRVYAPDPAQLWAEWKAQAPAVLALAAAGLTTLPRHRESWFLTAYCLASLLSVVVGPSADFARYSVHLLPIAVVLASVPLAILGRRLPVLALIACVLIAGESASSFRGARHAFQVGAKHAKCRLIVGRWLEQHLEPGTTVVSSDIGALAYAAPGVRFIDTVGLTSRDVLELRKRGQSPEPLLFEKAPTVIADTCSGDCTTPQQFSAHDWLSQQSYWRTPLPAHDEYFSHLHDGRVLKLCQTPDGLKFAATQYSLD